jgi:hypothetical protein
MARQWLPPISTHSGERLWGVMKMNKQSATKVWQNAWKTALWWLLALFLSACGTFEVGVETPIAPTLENAEQARPATGITPTSAGPADDAQSTATMPTIPPSTTTVQAGEPSQRSYQSNDHSSSPAISADGRYVAFQSGASNLVPDDTNDAGDIFVYDRKTGAVELISLSRSNFHGIGTAGAMISRTQPYLRSIARTMNRAKRVSENRWVSSGRHPRRGTCV